METCRYLCLQMLSFKSTEKTILNNDEDQKPKCFRKQIFSKVKTDLKFQQPALD